jgi:hypothetical protein
MTDQTLTDRSRPEEWSELTWRVLRSAAWYPERSVPVDRWEPELRAAGFVLHDAARSFLAEFGGLRTDTWTPGPVMPQSPFRFDPRVVAGARERFARFEKEAGGALYPLGSADSGACFLAMDAAGAVYAAADRLEPLAAGGRAAVEVLVMERRTDAPLPFVLAGGRLVLPHTPEQDRRPEIGTRWSAETDWALRRAGWHAGRAVDTDGWERRMREDHEGFVLHDAARRFLAEFGGLRIDQAGPGRTAARSPFALDPEAALHDFEVFDDLGDQAGAPLYPVGAVGRGVSYLGMTAGGAVYLGMDDAGLLAESGDEALDKLVEGRA